MTPVSWSPAVALASQVYRDFRLGEALNGDVDRLPLTLAKAANRYGVVARSRNSQQKSTGGFHGCYC
jgi:hypothetical protein